MNETTRTELFTVLAELSRHYPHWRMGQLVANVAGWADVEPWDAEGAELLAAARTHLATVEPRPARLPSECSGIVNAESMVTV